jgi:hypothetical protein
MSSPFAIDARLSPLDRQAFLDLIDGQRISIEAAQLWLADRGYDISHGAIGNFLKSRRVNSIDLLRPHFNLGPDSRTRRHVSRLAKELSGDDLTVLAVFIVFLVDLRRRLRSDQLPPMNETRPAESRANFSAVKRR